MERDPGDHNGRAHDEAERLTGQARGGTGKRRPSAEYWRIYKQAMNRLSEEGGGRPVGAEGC